MKITALIAVYNGARYISDAIDSALAQTRPPDEVLVVDDGSTDATPDIVRSYGHRIRYVRQANSGGPASPRNHGIRIASGDWIAFLDHDDWWAPMKLERQCQAVADNPNAVLVYTGCANYMLGDPEPQLRPAVPASQLWPAMRYRNCIALSSVMARTETLRSCDAFNEHIRTNEDWELWVRLLRCGPFVGLHEALLNYRVVPASLSADPEAMLDGLRHVLPTLLTGLHGIERWRWRQRILASQRYAAALIARDNKLPSEPRLMISAVLMWPWPGFRPERFKGLVVTLLRLTKRISSAC